MLFSSIPFLYYFLPAVLIFYFLAPRKGKNTVLLLFSLMFYGWGEPRLVLMMLLAVALGYFFGLGLEKTRGRGLGKLLLVLSVVSSLSFLVYYKYTDFFLENINSLFGLHLPLLGLALPIGISFYTFQIMSYTVDVYRGQVPAQRNFIDLACYVAFFPQLIAGPIVRYSDVAPQLKSRSQTLENCRLGAGRFLVGLGKKILLANLLGEVCTAWHLTQDGSVLFSWMYAVAYTLHIYFDFSGYSDMAIGLGRIFGFHFPENFRHPYVSGSITEFWRRWHISLGTWFRDYVYIPLGGNRRGKWCQLRNILVVWFLTGFWHGAAWNFILWGLYFGLLLIAEKLWLLEKLQKHRIMAHIYVLLAVIFGFVLFDAGSLQEAFGCIRGMLGLGGLPLISQEARYLLRSNALLLAVAAVGATGLPKAWFDRFEKRWPRGAGVLVPGAMCLVLLLCTAFLVDGSYNPFLYFRF